MKKFLSLFLAFTLLCGTLSALADALPAESGTQLPSVGDVIEGFAVKEVREIPFVGSTAVLFEHQKTGAGLMYLANEDTNRVFDLTFLTRPTDNTGLPHVFEHSTLDGSEKYPSKELFFNLSYQTYNTYMNASTYSIMTTYPIASLSEAQLLKYADFYTDSCLHPSIMEDESIFREEAWRYRMESMEDDLTLEGTVYSEMLGATTLERMANMNMFRTAFPGSVVGLDKGGYPDDIPNMTWESLKSYHDLYYHPSNCMAFLYGQFDDYTAFLALLNEAFQPYEKTDFHFVDKEYTPITESVSASFAYPVEATSSTENTSTVYYTILCPGLKDNPDEEMVLNTLTDLLVSDSSPLMQALQKAMPSGSFSCYIETTAPDDAIQFVGSNLNPEQAQLLKDTVDSTLELIAQNGFSQEMVDSVMATTDLSMKLTPESADVGVDLIPNIAYSYATSGDPFNYFDYVDCLSLMDSWNQQGLYTQAISKWLTGSTLTSLVTTYPEPGQKEAKDAELAAKLAEIKAGMTDEEKQAVIDATLAFETQDLDADALRAQISDSMTEEEKQAILNAADAAETASTKTASMVASLQAVTVDSLPEEVKLYTVKDETGADSVRRMDAYADIADVGRVALFLDAKGLSQDQIHYFKLFTDLIGKLNTDAHTKEELDVLSARYLYGRETRLSLLESEEENYIPYLRLGWTGMDHDFSVSYDLMYELIFGTQFTDVQMLKDQIQSIKSNLRSTINSSAYNILLYRALAVSSPLYRYYNYANFLEYYAFIEQIEAMLDSDPDSVVASLQGIQNYFHNAGNAISLFAGSEDSAAINRPLADAFLEKLDHMPVEHVTYELPVPASREGLIVDLNVNFNALVADYPSIGLEDYDAGLDALFALVSDVYLVPLLRDQYGVYSPLSGALSDGGVYMLTYRDPNITETYSVYESIADRLASLEVDQDTLDGYILSSYSYYAKNSGELTGAMNAATNILSGDPQDLAVEYMRQLKAVTPERIRQSAELFRAMAANGVRSTAGSASAVQGHPELYDVILNPFNAQDTSSVELTDVPESSEHYAAVRFAFEEGLMAPASDTLFGVDEPATVGDLAAALYLLVGGTPNAPQEAIETFASIGILSASDTAETILTNGLSDTILVNFGAAVGLPLQADEPNESTDLPQTRGELAEVLFSLFSE